MKTKIIFMSIFLLIFSLFNVKYNNSNCMIVHYIDVGQGDSILVQVNNKNLLIDSGPRINRDKLFDYLNSLNIETLDYVIATHPHEDHIGNMDAIIKKYNIKKFYSPKIEYTSKSFENMAQALKDKKLKINVIKCGTDSIDLGESTKVSVFSPLEAEYTNVNNYSPIIKIKFGKTAFMFTGDAQSDVEEAVINKGFDLSADILKFGHHGSSTSSSAPFLHVVNPSVGIISVGADNCYGHPSDKTLQLAHKLKIHVYRTDKDGTVVIISDGKSIYKKR